MKKKDSIHERSTRKCFFKLFFFFFCLLKCFELAALSTDPSTPHSFIKVLTVDDCVLFVTPASKWKAVEGRLPSRHHTFTTAFIPQGYTFQSAPAVVYMQCKPPLMAGQDLVSYATQDYQEQMDKKPSGSLKEGSVSGKKYVLQEYTSSQHDPYIVAYVPYKRHVILYILTGKNKHILAQYLKDLQTVIATSRYGYFLENGQQNGQVSYIYQMENGQKETFHLSEK